MNTGSRQMKTAGLLFLSPNETGDEEKIEKISETLADLETITTFASAIGKTDGDAETTRKLEASIATETRVL